MFRELLKQYQEKQPDNQWWSILLSYPDWDTVEEMFEHLMKPFEDPDHIGSYVIPVYPPVNCIFRCFELCPYDQCQMILMGQDPYINEGEAMGLCFSIPSTCHHIPPSLKNIFKELKNDMGVVRENTDLSDWAKQGMLLLNASLTVLSGKSNSHKSIWVPFIRWFWEEVIGQWPMDRPLLCILWGRDAQQWKTSTMECIESAHPSPLSATRGFFGSRPFTKIQAWRIKHGYSIFQF